MLCTDVRDLLLIEDEMVISGTSTALVGARFQLFDSAKELGLEDHRQFPEAYDFTHTIAQQYGPAVSAVRAFHICGGHSITSPKP